MSDFNWMMLAVCMLGGFVTILFLVIIAIAIGYEDCDLHPEDSPEISKKGG